MNIETVKKVLACLLLAAITVAVVNLHWNLRLFVREGNATMQELRRGSAAVADFAESQTALLKSDRYQKSIQAGIDVGATANGALRLFNRQVIPKVANDLDRLDGLLTALTINSQTLSTLLVNTDRNVNGEGGLIPSATALLQSLTATANRFNVSIETLDSMLKTVAEKGGMSLDEIYKLVASPEWKAVLVNTETVTANLASTSRRVDLTVEEIRKAAEKAPSIAESLDKLARTSSKFQKVQIIVSIVATLARAFLP